MILLSERFFVRSKGKVSSALSYKESGKLDKAWEAIQEAINPANPKSENNQLARHLGSKRGNSEAISKSKDENYKN